MNDIIFNLIPGRGQQSLKPTWVP